MQTVAAGEGDGLPPGKRLARSVAAGLVLFVLFFYTAVVAQHVGRYVTARVLGASIIELRLGAGRPRQRVEVIGAPVDLCQEWWWGPQVSARGKIGPDQQIVVLCAGFLVNLLVAGVLMWDLRRGRGALSYIGIAANLAAIGAALLLAAG